MKLKLPIGKNISDQTRRKYAQVSNVQT